MKTTIACSLLLFTAALQAGEPGKLSLSDGQSRLMTYNASHVPSPDKDAPWYGRSGFIHPVYTPSSRVVTAGFPRDHMHQHGLMFAWTSSVVEGKPVDFWNSHKKEGRIEHVDTIQHDNDSIVVQLRHINETSQQPTTILNETWKLTRVAHDTYHVFDLVSTQNCATPQPFEVAEYHYGGMCIRGPLAWLNGGAMLTSDGKNQSNGNHTRPNWVAMTGKVDGKMCGIAAIGHPGNFRGPQAVRLHPEKPYFCFAPMVQGDLRIEPSKPYVSRFRFVAFDGAADARRLNELWKQFSE